MRFGPEPTAHVSATHHSSESQDRSSLANRTGMLDTGLPPQLHFGVLYPADTHHTALPCQHSEGPCLYCRELGMGSTHPIQVRGLWRSEKNTGHQIPWECVMDGCRPPELLEIKHGILHFRPTKMAAAVQDSRVSPGGKLKRSPKKKKKMKKVAKAAVSKLEDELKDSSEGEGSCESEMDYSDDGAVEADSEDNVESCEEENEDAAESTAGTNSGWADAMAKILNKKTSKSKPTILTKNKELEKEKEKLKQERLEKRKQIDKKREWEMLCRVKPDVIKDKEAERNLQRIATRGVVQLFNAVQKHQRNVGEKVKEVGGSIRKRAKLMSTVSKKDFISVLRGMDGTSENSPAGKSPKARQTEVKSEEGPGWKILRDDFMMGASMKDWDKESEGEEQPADGQAGSASH